MPDPDHAPAQPTADPTSPRPVITDPAPDPKWDDRTEYEALAKAYAQVDAHLPEVPGFLVFAPLGGGGNGVVYQAYDIEFQRVRALKFLRPERFRPADAEAFLREAQFLDDLPASRHRVRVYQVIPLPRSPVIVMEVVEGGALRRHAPLPWEDVARYGAQMAEALGDVHARGFRHGDLTPANILVRPGDPPEAVLADFGLAVRAAGFTGGTPGFAAPEVRDGTAGPAADVFGLAASLFYLLASQPPFPTAGGLAGSTAAAAAGLPEVLPLPPGVPPEFEQLLRDAMHPDPRRRIGLGEFRAGLRRVPIQVRLDRLCELQAGAAAPPLTATLEVLDDAGRVRDRVVCGSLPPNAPGAGVRAATGELFRLHVDAGRSGHVRVIDFKSSGPVEVVVPNRDMPDARSDPGQPVRMVGRVGPPSGTDYLVVIWTPQVDARPPQECVAAIVGQWEQSQSSADLSHPVRDIDLFPGPAAPPPDAAAIVLRIDHEEVSSGFSSV